MVRKDAEFDRRENGFCVIARHDIYAGMMSRLFLQIEIEHDYE